MTLTKPPEEHVFLILVKTPLVATDIAQALCDYAPGARVITVWNMPDALAAMASEVAIDAAYIKMAPSAPDADLLAEAVRERGGKVVFVGVAAEAEGPGPGYSILTLPFNSEMVIAALSESPHSSDPR